MTFLSTDTCKSLPQCHKTLQFSCLPVFRQYPWMSDTSLEVRMISCLSAWKQIPSARQSSVSIVLLCTKDSSDIAKTCFKHVLHYSSLHKNQTYYKDKMMEWPFLLNFMVLLSSMWPIPWVYTLSKKIKYSDQRDEWKISPCILMIMVSMWHPDRSHWNFVCTFSGREKYNT